MLLRKSTSIIALFIAVSYLGFAQEQNSEPIKQVNKRHFQQIVQRDSVFTLDSVRLILNRAKKEKYNLGEAEALKNIGIHYYFLREMDSALHYYQQGLAVAKSEAPNEVSMSLYSNVGVVYVERAEYKEGIKYYLMAKNEAVALNDSAMMLRVLNNLSSVEMITGNLVQAEQTLKEAMSWMGSNNPMRVTILTSQASLYARLGDTTLSIEKYKQAVALQEDAPPSRVKVNLLNNYGNLLSVLGQKQPAILLHSEALAIAEKIGYTEAQLAILNQMGGDAYKEGNVKKALSFYKQAAAQADGFLPLQRTIYTNLVMVYHALGDYKNAFASLQMLDGVKDSINNAEVRKTIEELKNANAVQQAEMKTTEVALQAEKQKRTLSSRIAWLSIGLGVSLLAVGLVMYLRQRQQWKIKQQQIESLRQKSELEIQLFRTRMNPHFFFNALYSIQNYILNNNTLESSRYLGKFARLARAVLEWNTQPLVLIEKEISILEDYLSLEQLRFEGKFDYELICDEEVAKHCQIPTMVLQPFVENAIIHGMSNLSYAGKIQVTFNENETKKQLEVIIEDNGVGVIDKKENESHLPEKQSLALSLTQKRLALLSEQYGGNYYFTLEDKKQLNPNEQGVRVQLFLPLIQA